MRKKRKMETKEERMARLNMLKEDFRDAAAAEDDALDAMVQNSIERHGP